MKHFAYKLSRRLALALVMLALLLPAGAALAQTTPTTGSSDEKPATRPAWFDGLPAYTGLEKLQVEDSALSGLGVKPSQAYFQVGLASDPVGTVADFYAKQLPAAGWQLQNKSNIMSEQVAQQLTFANPAQANAQLVVLVAGKAALQLAPQFKALDAKVPQGKTIVALIALTTPIPVQQNKPKPTPAAASSGERIGATGTASAPVWFKDLPQYDLKPIQLDNATFAALGIDPATTFVRVGLTPDNVKTVTDFYSTKLRAVGWPDPAKQSLGGADVGQILDYQDGKLTVLVAAKTAFALLPDAKALNQQVPDGQTVVALIAPVDAAPKPGTLCQLNSECQVGPYKVRVNLDATSFNTVDSFTATIERLDNPTGDWQLKAEAVPSTSTSATAVDYSGDFERGTAAKRSVKINLPISGNWYLYLTIKDQAGDATFYTPPLQAAPPGIMPENLAWALGLSPLLGIIGFAIGQTLYVRRRRRADKQPAETPPTPTPQPDASLV